MESTDKITQKMENKADNVIEILFFHRNMIILAFQADST